jgi:flagellar biosynthesis anti-sigma factor FlgM
MNIDPKINLNGSGQPEPVKHSRANSAKAVGSQSEQGISAVRGEDSVTLSGIHGTVQTLSAKLAEVPEVRTERVQTLQQNIQSGQYQVDKGKVADAIMKDHSRRNSKA